MKNKYFCLILIVVFVVIINLGFLAAVKKTEFPFLTIAHKYRTSDFNSSGLDFKIPLSQQFIDKVRADLEPKLESQNDPFVIVSVITEYVRPRLFYQDGARVDDLDRILETEEEDPAICSGYAKFLAAVSQALGYESRVIWMEHHTTSEIYFPDYGWVLADSNGNLMFKDESGKYAGLFYIIDNFDKAVPVRITAESDNDLDFISLDKVGIYKYNKVVVAVEGSHLLDFSARTKSSRLLINYILGREDIAKAVQYTTGRRELLGNFRYSIIALIIFDFCFLIIFIICLFFKKKKYVRDSGSLGQQ